MGRIYREAESVVVWLGHASRISELCISLLAETTNQATVPLPVQSARHEDKMIPTSTTAGIDAKFRKNAILGAAAVTLSQWYVMSIPEPFAGHTLTSHVYTQVRTDLGRTGTLLGQRCCLPYRRSRDKRRQYRQELRGG